ncbi:MAG: hypothetical protein LBB89_13475 [Treponema sp.]|jgi:hypothetical protein|nr:hypothetical protein [Treponema sp.]
MQVGTKIVTINRNLDRVRNDFIKLTVKSRSEKEKSDCFKLFYGKIIGNNFNYYCSKFGSGNLNTPELSGELFEKSNGETLIIIRIKASFGHIFINIVYAIWMIYFIFYKLLKDWSKTSIYSNIFILIMLFMFPIIQIGYYLYCLKEMINDFNLYNEGYYDKYIK